VGVRYRIRATGGDCAAEKSNFSAGNRDGLSGDGTGAGAAQPDDGIGHFGRRDQFPLRIVFCELGMQCMKGNARLSNNIPLVSVDLRR